MSVKTNTADAVKIIADAAAEASKTIASAAAEALKVKQEGNSGDHQLLLNLDKNFVRLDTKVDQIQSDVTTLKNQDSKNITQDQHQGLCTKTDDQEIRIRSLEEFKQNWLGKVSIIGVVASVVVSALFMLVQNIIH